MGEAETRASRLPAAPAPDRLSRAARPVVC